MPPYDSDNTTPLDRAIQQRLAEIGMDYTALAAESGVRTQTIRDLRRGRTRRVRDLTAWALDDALRWERGSLQAVMAGGTPTPLLPPPQPTMDRTDEIEQSAWILHGAMRAGEEVYIDAVDRMTKRLSQTELHEVFSRLTEITLGDDPTTERRRRA